MSLLELPLELWAMVDSHLDQEDRLQLCQTCRSLMYALQASAYHHFELDESAASGRRALALASGPRAGFVRVCDYKPRCPEPLFPREVWGVYAGPTIELSEETRQALSTLHRFQNLSQVCVDAHDWFMGTGAIPWPVLERYTYEEWLQRFDEEPWKILMVKSLAALAQSAGAFRSLLFRNLPALPTERPYPILETPAWLNVLRSLTCVNLNFYPPEKDTMMAALADIYEEPLTSFSTNFYQNLTNVQSLRINRIYHGQLPDGEFDATIPWGSFRMPRLKTLWLRSFTIYSDFLQFWKIHLETLETVHMYGCHTPRKRIWRQMFEQAAAVSPKQLVRFEIIPYPVLRRKFYPNKRDWKAATDLLWDIGNASVPQSRCAGTLEAEPTDSQLEDARRPVGIGNSTLEGEVPRLADWDQLGGCSLEDLTFYRGCECPHSPWNEGIATLNSKCRRFVVARREANNRIDPVEGIDEYPDGELDESDVVDQWEKVMELIESNKAPATAARARDDRY
ncbi:hypothetical protein HJFPF1_07819 [Paramyrothecium foliicola]|nr:hypothetical protein HJFPF1_07819 [Paramyrothecium foliicola]